MRPNGNDGGSIQKTSNCTGFWAKMPYTFMPCPLFYSVIGATGQSSIFRQRVSTDIERSADFLSNLCARAPWLSGGMVFQEQKQVFLNLRLEKPVSCLPFGGTTCSLHDLKLQDATFSWSAWSLTACYWTSELPTLYDLRKTYVLFSLGHFINRVFKFIASQWYNGEGADAFVGRSGVQSTELGWELQTRVWYVMEITGEMKKWRDRLDCVVRAGMGTCSRWEVRRFTTCTRIIWTSSCAPRVAPCLDGTCWKTLHTVPPQSPPSLLFTPPGDPSMGAPPQYVSLLSLSVWKKRLIRPWQPLRRWC